MSEQDLYTGSEKTSVDNQVIVLGGWKNFVLQVMDQNRRPVRGVRVAWRTPDMGSYTFVGVTDANGASAATNLYTVSTPGVHQQTADVVEGDAVLGFTDWSKLRPTGKTITFGFKFAGK